MTSHPYTEFKSKHSNRDLKHNSTDVRWMMDRNRDVGKSPYCTSLGVGWPPRAEYVRQ